MANQGVGLLCTAFAEGQPLSLSGLYCGGSSGNGSGRHGGPQRCFAGRGVDWKLAGAMGFSYSLRGQQYGHRSVDRWTPSAVGVHQPVTPTLEAAKELDDELSKRPLDLDPQGYFVIRVDRTRGEIVAEFFRNVINAAGLACDPDTGKVIPCDGSYRPRPQSVFRGKTAKEISVLIIEAPERAKQPVISMLTHANYLGREFQKAEAALYQGHDYIQD